MCSLCGEMAVCAADRFQMAAWGTIDKRCAVNRD
jgi:hypothetical protein